ncbi:amidohydrolase family protein [Actinomycetospora endophytica]|uniref:Amidohydrolase family protein n=1 Tax=Actinomycetospora endophytica TaxID=2291215 RepID=A0ABS8PFU3_9PSEU|nr:amidohydrolase family protein [Actinomycetospora endophytica]MCD2197114.1 amidohydrolase family protein [Actinomycetospora endophytica]
MTPLHLHGVVLDETARAGDGARDLWVDEHGRFTDGPIADAQTITGWILPGLVDAHCHVGIGPDGPVELEEARAQGHIDAAAGALLIRDCGSPVDTRPLDDDPEMPEIVRAGRHLARPKRYIRGLPIDAEDPADLPGLVAEQAWHNPWVKLVGDWIDRDEGDLAPLWPDDVLRDAMDAAHAHGARVTAHVFGEHALPGLIGAGIDCIEHGTGLTDETIAMMAARGTALVPTLINVENFPEFADAAGEKFPRYGTHMRELYARASATIRAAIEAGVTVYAGTDAGGGIVHGRIVDEVEALADVGLGRDGALAAATVAARTWLGRPRIEAGAPADVLVLPSDPYADLGVLRRPVAVLRHGRVLAP